jgi:hypothetical protein
LDVGSTWAAVGTLSQVGMAGLTSFSPELLAATREGHTAASLDGVTWTWRGSINQVGLRALGADTPATGVEVVPPVGGAFELSAPEPNPLRLGASRFRFRTQGTETLSFTLLDAGGRRVDERRPETFEGAGPWSLSWDPGPLPAGVYFVRVTSASGDRDGTR